MTSVLSLRAGWPAFAVSPASFASAMRALALGSSNGRGDRIRTCDPLLPKQKDVLFKGFRYPSKSLQNMDLSAIVFQGLS